MLTGLEGGGEGLPCSVADASGTARQLWHTIAIDRPEQAARLALRTRSVHARDALALAVSGGAMGDADVQHLALTDRIPVAFMTKGARRRLAALALTWAGTQRSSDDLDAAASAYLAIFRTTGAERLAVQHHRIAAQSLFLTGRRTELAQLLPHLSRLPDGARSFLLTDLANPYLNTADLGERGRSSDERHRHWEQLLSNPFTRHGLGALSVDPAGPDLSVPPFDRLTCRESAPATHDGPLVSVVMPCYRPNEGLLTSIASICDQTYGALEVLLVDDASGPGSDALFEQAVALDDRVTLIRMSSNGGPYLARNEALSRARGDFVTFQDADDWSHPARLHTQVARLTESLDAPACHTLAVRAHDDLTHQWLGSPTVRVHASSLMARSCVFDQLGPFLPVRKGADSEYAERIAAGIGPVSTIQAPLAVKRLQEGSLSLNDFSYHWGAPDRLAFRGIYRARLRAERPPQAPFPLTFLPGIGDRGRVSSQVATAYLADFSADPNTGDDPATALWSSRREINPEGTYTAVPAQDPRVGIWHFETPWRAGAKRSDMHDLWFDHIVAEPKWQTLTRVETVHVDRAVVLDPSVLLLVGDQECRVSAESVEVHTGRPAAASRQDTPPVDEEAVADVVQRWFGVEPTWVRVDPSEPDQGASNDPRVYWR